MYTVNELKELLSNDFTNDINKYLENIKGLSGSALNIGEDGAKELHNKNFIYPKINESDNDPGVGERSPVLSEIYPKPTNLNVAYDDALKMMRNGGGNLMQNGYTKTIPGWKQYYDSLSKSRYFGYQAIFHTGGFSQYIMNADEYKNYVSDLNSSPNYGPAIVKELKLDIEYKPQLVGPDGILYQTRDAQIKNMALSLWHWQNSKKILAFIESYRWFPRNDPQKLKESDKSNNTDRKKAYKDDIDIISSTMPEAYGIIKPGGMDIEVDQKFKSRYNLVVFNRTVSLINGLEKDLLKNNSTYTENLFEKLMEGDAYLRRKRALDSLLKDGKLNPKLFEEEVWKAQIEAAYSKFIEHSKKPGKKGYKKDKNGNLERDKNTGEYIIIDFNEAQWIETILSFSKEAFTAALRAIDIVPKYRAWRRDPGGLPAVQFEWQPDSEVLRQIFILKAYGENSDKAKQIGAQMSPSSPTQTEEKGTFKGAVKGSVNRLFGEKIGFASSESTSSTSGFLGLTPEQREEAKKERQEKRELRKNEQSEGKNIGAKSSSEAKAESSKIFEAKGESSDSESSSITSGATNITNINNQTVNVDDQKKVVNEGANIINSQEGNVTSIDNKQLGLSGSSEAIGSSPAISSDISNTKSVANINNLNTAAESSKSENIMLSNQTTSNTKIESPQSINNSTTNESKSVNQSNDITSSTSPSTSSLANTSVTETNSSINSSQADSKSNVSSVSNNVSTESKGPEIKVDRGQVNVSNLKSNTVVSEAPTVQPQNMAMTIDRGQDSSNITNVTNQNEENQSAGNVTTTNNSMSDTPIIQNNIDMSEMISRLKRIEEALLSPLEVKIIDA
jgi:hypothetical protein